MLRRHFMTNNKIITDIIITYTAMRKICDIPIGCVISEDLAGIYGNESNIDSNPLLKYKIVINNYDYTNEFGTIGLKIIFIGEPFPNSFITEKLLTSGTQIYSILKNNYGGAVKSSLYRHDKKFGYMSNNGSINNIVDCEHFDDFDNRDAYIKDISISEGVELISGLVTPYIDSNNNITSPLTGDIKLPSTLKAIGVAAFFGVDVHNIIIPYNVKYICAGAFAECTSNILITPLNPPKIDTIFGEKYPEYDYNLNYLPRNSNLDYNVYYDKKANIKLFNYNIDDYKNDEKWKDHIDRMSECDTYIYVQSTDSSENILNLVKENIISSKANEYCFSTIDQSNNNDAIIINTKITNNNNIYLYYNTEYVKASKYYINNKLMNLITINTQNDNYLKTLIIKNIAKIDDIANNYYNTTNYNKLLYFEYDVEYASTNGVGYAFGFNDISKFIIGENVKYLPKQFIQFHNSNLENKYLNIPYNVEIINDNCFDIGVGIWNIRLDGNLKYVGDHIFRDILGGGQNYYYDLKLFIPGVEDNRLDFLANLKFVSSNYTHAPAMFDNKYTNLYINGLLAQNKDLYIGVNPNNGSLNSLNLIGCTIKFLDNVNIIGDNTFYYTKCSVLDLTNIKHIGNNSWIEPNKIILSNSIEFIGNEAFRSGNINEIVGDVKNLPNLDYVGWRIFNNELENTLNLGEGVIYLGNTLYKQKGILENNTLICKEGIKYVNLDIDPSIENIILPEGIVKINLFDINSFKKTQFYKNQPDNEPIYIGNYYICFKGDTTEYNGNILKDNTILTADRISDTNVKKIKCQTINFPSTLIRIGDYSLREFYVEPKTFTISIQSNINLGKNCLPMQDSFNFNNIDLITSNIAFYEKNAIYVNNKGVVDLSFSGITSLNACVNLYNVAYITLPINLQKIAIDDFISYNGITSIQINNTMSYFVNIEKEKYWDAPFRQYKDELSILCSDGTVTYNFIKDTISYQSN